MNKEKYFSLRLNTPIPLLNLNLLYLIPKYILLILNNSISGYDDPCKLNDWMVFGDGKYRMLGKVGKL